MSGLTGYRRVLVVTAVEAERTAVLTGAAAAEDQRTIVLAGGVGSADAGQGPGAAAGYPDPSGV